MKLYAIGDFIMALPGLHLLRQLWPGARIELLTGSMIAPVARCCAPVDEVIPVQEYLFSKRRGCLGLLSLTLRLRKRRYDRAYLLHRVLPLRMLLLATGTPIRTGQGEHRAGLTDVVAFETGHPEHDAERYARLFGWPGSRHLPEVGIQLPDRALPGWLRTVTESRPVAVSPGGGRSSIRNMDRKRWPPDRFAELIRMLDGKGYETVLLGSEDDRSILMDLTGDLPASAIELMGRTTLLEAAAALSRCRLLITNDSSLMHLAGLVRTPTLALFGPTDPLRTGVYPPSTSHRNLVPESVDCSPCHPGDRMQSCESGRCMLSIGIDRVWRETARMLEEVDS